MPSKVLNRKQTPTVVDRRSHTQQTESFDQKIRTAINSYVSSTYGTLPDQDYQLQLSRILCQVECSDTGNAIRLAARYGQTMRWVADRGKWFLWNGRIWQQDDTFRAMGMAAEGMGYILVESDHVPPPRDEHGQPLMYPQVTNFEKPTPQQKAILEKFEIYEKRLAALKKWCLTSRNRPKLNAALEQLKSEPGVTITYGALDADDYLLNARNGTIDLRSRTMRPHNRHDLITKMVAIDYDPDATCPQWDSFMSKAMLNKNDMVRFLAQIVGMGLSGAQLDDILPIFYGSGGNGKTVFVELLKELLAAYADTATTDLFLEKQNEGINNDVASLVGVRFLTASETKENRHLDEVVVKGLTGGDTQKARFLHQEYFNFKPKFTAVLLTNHRPVVKGTDDGIWRRLHFIPWSYKFELDPQRMDKPEVLAMLREELSGVLNWCLHGYFDRVDHGLQVPESVKNATSEYRKDSDIIGEFLDDSTIPDKKGRISKKELYMLYTNWCEDQGHKSLAGNRLSIRLKERGIDDSKSNGIKYWSGLRRREPDEVPPDNTPEEEPPTQTEPELETDTNEEVITIPTPDQVENYPEDIIITLAAVGIVPEDRTCYKCREIHWLPYYVDGLPQGHWRYGCAGENCHPEIMESKGQKFYP